MVSSPPTCVSAELRLRGAAGPLPVRVLWPANAQSRLADVVVILFADRRRDGDDVDSWLEQLTSHLGAVTVLAPSSSVADAPALCLDAAIRASRWAVEHAAELDARPRSLIVGGWGTGADLAAETARRALANPSTKAGRS